ncbi:MAG: hypothetical protein HY906_08090 [Deltaproteobacteria bacterium]|nr:hypothetical protein [Deltaproteobacteria bacterium]
MSDIERKVLEETERFRAALPELIKQHPGRWVVFRDGQVVSDHATEDEAYRAAVARFGVTGGFVVAPVVEVEPTPVTAGVMFGAC